MLENAADSGDAVLGFLRQLRCDVELPKSMAGFLTQVEEPSIQSHDNRRFARRAARTVAALEHRQTFPLIPRQVEWHKIFTRDISRGGLAFLHSCQLYPRERMRVLLPDPAVAKMVPDRQQGVIEVARCRRLAPRCYEIGAFFVDDLTESDA